MRKENRTDQEIVKRNGQIVDNEKSLLYNSHSLNKRYESFWHQLVKCRRESGKFNRSSSRVVVERYQHLFVAFKITTYARPFFGISDCGFCDLAKGRENVKMKEQKCK